MSNKRQVIFAGGVEFHHDISGERPVSHLRQEAAQGLTDLISGSHANAVEIGARQPELE